MFLNNKPKQHKFGAIKIQPTFISLEQESGSPFNWNNKGTSGLVAQAVRRSPRFISSALVMVRLAWSAGTLATHGPII